MAENNVVIVHGVQTGDDLSAVGGPKKMEQTLTSFVANRAEFSVAYPAYEHLNEEAQSSIKLINKLILSRLNKPAEMVVDKLIDIVGDVYGYEKTGVGEKIRDFVRAEIEKHPNCILLGHSLGSVVSFDILMDMFGEGLFKGKKITEWPVRSFITFGSPLALDMFSKKRQLLNHEGNETFYWFNYSDRNDPVISGNIFGNEFKSNNMLRDAYQDPSGNTLIEDYQVETGFHLLSHVNYWDQDQIIAQIANNFA